MCHSGSRQTTSIDPTQLHVIGGQRDRWGAMPGIQIQASDACDRESTTIFRAIPKPNETVETNQARTNHNQPCMHGRWNQMDTSRLIPTG